MKFAFAILTSLGGALLGLFKWIGMRAQKREELEVATRLRDEERDAAARFREEQRAEKATNTLIEELRTQAIELRKEISDLRKEIAQLRAESCINLGCRERRFPKKPIAS